MDYNESMVKSANKKRKRRMKLNNLVAKHARTFNRAATHRDRKNDFRRKAKHPKRED
jgi:hypothetical protein